MKNENESLIDAHLYKVADNGTVKEILNCEMHIQMIPKKGEMFMAMMESSLKTFCINQVIYGDTFDVHMIVQEVNDPAVNQIMNINFPGKG